MNVLIVNQHTNNFGDDAAGTALVNALLQVGVKRVELLYCMPSKLPIEDERVIHNHFLNVRSLRKPEYLAYAVAKLRCGSYIPGLLKKLDEYDLVLVSPCGSNLGIYKDWQLLMQDLVIVSKKRLVFHLNTIAASGDRLFDLLVRKVCKRSAVYVRERASQRYLESVGIKSTWGPDTAFLLESKGDAIENRDKIVFVPSDVWSWHVDFMNREGGVFEGVVLPGLAWFARTHGKGICILAHTNSSAEMDFNASVKRDLQRIDARLDVEIPEISDVYDYENHIRGAWMVVGMRYHSIVLAVKNGVPFLALSYEQKMVEVSEYSGERRYCVKLRDLEEDPEVVGRQMGELLEELAGRHDELASELLCQAEQLKRVASVVIREQVVGQV